MSEKFCKHCKEHHPCTKEFWEFSKEGTPFRCKIHRRKKYNAEGREKAAEYWKALPPEQRAEKAARKRELRKSRSTVDIPKTPA